ncbi:hypothetical protein [Candidatus Leptofilum sp.]|uniref:hypothetical protein n=1 Tax=Candidatus Leptofilum sp. TaxID=3241576 RepID=UPI003B5A17B7
MMNGRLPNSNILPAFTLHTIASVVSAVGEPPYTAKATNDIYRSRAWALSLANGRLCMAH